MRNSWPTGKGIGGMRFTLCALLLSALLSLAAAEPPQSPISFTKITLRDPKIPLSKALEALARQTGFRIDDNRGDEPPTLTLDLNNTPFWLAIDEIAQKAQARVALSPKSGIISLVKRPVEALPALVSHDGPFRVAVKGIQGSLDFDSGVNQYTLTLEVAWEPSLQPLFLETRAHDLVMKDDSGKMVPIADEGSSMAPVHGLIAEIFTIPLPALPRTTKKIALLQGKLSVMAPSKMLAFSFATLEQIEKELKENKPPQQMQDGVTCSIGKAMLLRDRWTVQIRLDYPPGATKLESYQSWMVNNEIYLEDKDKKRLKPSGYLIESSSTRGAVLTYHFTDQEKMPRGLPRNWRVVYRTPASIVEVPFGFSFKDITLP